MPTLYRNLRQITSALRALNTVLSRVALAVGMMVIAFAAVALFAQAIERHTTGQGYAWMNDFPPFLIPWCVFPIMGVLLRGDRHIMVEVAPTMLKGRALAVLKIFIGLVALTAGLYFAYTGWEAVAFFQLMGEVTQTEIQIPFWWLYAAFPVGFAILALFALERILEQLLVLAGHPLPDLAEDGGSTQVSA